MTKKVIDEGVWYKMLIPHFGNSPRFWMNLQVSYDLAMAEDDMAASFGDY